MAIGNGGDGGHVDRDSGVVDGGGTTVDGLSADARVDQCGVGGSTIIHGGDGVDICAGELAAQTFGRAFCACDSFTTSALTIDSFDSDDGAYTPGQGGGDLGVNGKLDATGEIDIGGSLNVSDPEGILGGDLLRVGGDLFDQGQLLRAQTRVEVGGNAQVGGDIALTDLIVAGSLTRPAGALTSISGQLQAGAQVTAAVAVAPPCACEPTDLLDIAGIVLAHRDSNDNAAIGLDPTAFEDFPGTAELSLPCGRFYLDRIQGTSAGTLTISVDGRAALFVDQAITLQQTLNVVLGPAGELDLFVAGNVNTAGFVSLGEPGAPSRVRTYIGGAGSFNLGAETTFGNNLYAPLVDLALSSPTELFGAAFVHRINTADPLSIHYDRAVVSASASCP